MLGIRRIKQKPFLMSLFVILALIFPLFLFISKIEKPQIIIKKAAETVDSCVRNLSSQIVPLTYAPHGQPFKTRTELDEYELAVSKQAIPELASLSLPPKTFAEADIIRQIREKETNWPSVCGLKDKSVEIIVNKSAIDLVNQMRSEFGGNFEELMNAHVAEMNRILSTAPDKIDRVFVLRRILVVDDGVVSGKQSNGSCTQTTSTPIPKTGWKSDFDQNGVINVADYAVWRKYFTESLN